MLRTARCCGLGGRGRTSGCLAGTLAEFLSQRSGGRFVLGVKRRAGSSQDAGGDPLEAKLLDVTVQVVLRVCLGAALLEWFERGVPRRAHVIGALLDEVVQVLVQDDRQRVSVPPEDQVVVLLT
jgi:hypothetical protein